MSSLQAVPQRRFVEISWEVGSGEVSGFHVWRSQGDDTFERITGNTLVGGPGYDYLDVDVIAGREYGYRIEALLPGGGTQTFGPITVTAAVPDRVALDQNVPNPFNPTTSVSYQIPAASHVRLLVYNTLGQEMARIVDVEQVAGYYRATWDGRNATGRNVASGVYFARLVVDARDGVNAREVRTIRMLMVR